MPGNLDKIDHIVVLMMENRSFDHMLGYLSLEQGRSDIDGLTGAESNRHDGQIYPVYELHHTAIQDDPPHNWPSVQSQLKGGNQGFVTAFAATHPSHESLDVVMGYYTHRSVSVYDHLARAYCVCDRWFSAIPGPTMPNRL